jgi:cytochrome c oxidase subunit 4
MTNHVDVRGYLIVFGALLVLTALTVAVSALSMPQGLATSVGLGIAAAKGTLVALFFMHLKYERAVIYVTLAFTAVFCAALFGLTLWSEADHVFGTEFTQPFQQGER